MGRATYDGKSGFLLRIYDFEREAGFQLHALDEERAIVGASACLRRHKSRPRDTVAPEFLPAYRKGAQSPRNGRARQRTVFLEPAAQIDRPGKRIHDPDVPATKACDDHPAAVGPEVERSDQVVGCRRRGPARVEFIHAIFIETRVHFCVPEGHVWIRFAVGEC